MSARRDLRERELLGDWLNVAVVAKVYDLQEIQRQGRVPDVPLAQGPEVQTRARTDWGVVDLVLPPLQAGEYAVVAKVYSSDDRYRRPFAPSNCYVAVIEMRDSLAPA